MSFLKQTFSEFSRNRCTTLAAALAYYTAFSLPPLLYLLLMVLVFGMSAAYDSDEARQKARETLRNQTTQLIGNEAASEEISTILDHTEQVSGKGWKTLLSLAGILLGATGLVGALQTSLNQVWEVEPDPEQSGFKNLLGKRFLSFVMILGLGLLLLASLVLSTVVAALGEQLQEQVGLSQTVASVLNYVVQGLLVFAIIAAIFKFMPDAEVRWKDVLVGALITTVLFLVGRYAMQLYFSFSQPGAELGSAAASLVVLLVWVYYTAMIVLLGAEATQVYAVRYGKGIRPQPGAVLVVRQLKPRAASASH